MKRIYALVASLFLVVACGLFAGCSQTQQVAGSILGEDISEQSVTDYIQSFRDALGYTDESSWATYLSDKGMTAEQLRQATIVELAGNVVISQKADELGITVSDSEVDKEVSEFRQALMATDDATWNATLKLYKTSESELRERYRQGLLEEKVYKAVIGDITPTDQDIASYIEENLAGKTTKRFVAAYGINYADAQALLDEIRSASSLEAGFASAKSKANGQTIAYEEFGWDIDPETTEAMAKELANLNVGECSSMLVSDSDVGAYEILYVVDSYTFPTSNPQVSDLPESLKPMLSKLASQRVFALSSSSWLSEQVNNNLKTNPMPSGLSYDVKAK